LTSPAALNAHAAPPRATTGYRAFLASLSLTVGNPKVIVFFLSILPLALDLDKLNVLDLVTVAGVAAVVLSGTLGAYALAANRVRGWLGQTRAVKFIRRAIAGVMAGVAVAILAR
jgi:threonine/homoserine/homoserine lactone efflux protein